MEFLPNGFTLELCPGAFPLSTDSMVLSHFVKLPPKARVLDFGSGCGTLGLLLAAKDPACTVTGLEIDPAAHACAWENIRRNRLETRMESICADLRQLPNHFTGHFDCCVSNPPYFSGGAPSQRLSTARQEEHCTPADLFAAAAKALKYGGDFFLVHKPERLAELIARGSECRLEAKRLLLVRHRESSPVNLICLQFRKGGKPGLTWEDISLFDQDGMPTPIYRTIYHLQED